MGGKTERPPGAILGGIGRGGITRAGLFSSLSLFNDKFEKGLSRSITEKIRESKKREKGKRRWKKRKEKESRAFAPSSQQS